MATFGVNCDIRFGNKNNSDGIVHPPPQTTHPGRGFTPPTAGTCRGPPRPGTPGTGTTSPPAPTARVGAGGGRSHAEWTTSRLLPKDPGGILWLATLEKATRPHTRGGGGSTGCTGKKPPARPHTQGGPRQVEMGLLVTLCLIWGVKKISGAWRRSLGKFSTG